MALSSKCRCCQCWRSAPSAARCSCVACQHVAASSCARLAWVAATAPLQLLITLLARQDVRAAASCTCASGRSWPAAHRRQCCHARRSRAEAAASSAAIHDALQPQNALPSSMRRCACHSDTRSVRRRRRRRMTPRPRPANRLAVARSCQRCSSRRAARWARQLCQAFPTACSQALKAATCSLVRRKVAAACTGKSQCIAMVHSKHTRYKNARHACGQGLSVYIGWCLTVLTCSAARCCRLSLL